MSGIARFSLVAIDTRQPRQLAQFYADITGWQVDPDSHDGWVELTADTGATIAFQLAPDHVQPQWPATEHPQQLHLDFDVADLDEGEQAVLALGAEKALVQPGSTFRVYLDPAGHPFCLVQE